MSSASGDGFAQLSYVDGMALWCQTVLEMGISKGCCQVRQGMWLFFIYLRKGFQSHDAFAGKVRVSFASSELA